MSGTVHQQLVWRDGVTDLQSDLLCSFRFSQRNPILQVSIWILSPGISFAYRFDPLRAAGRTRRGRGAHILSTFLIVGRDTSKSCERFSSLWIRREPNPRARKSTIHARSRSEIRIAGELNGRRDSVIKPSRPHCRYRFSHLRSVGFEMPHLRQTCAQFWSSSNSCTHRNRLRTSLSMHDRVTGIGAHSCNN